MDLKFIFHPKDDDDVNIEAPGNSMKFHKRFSGTVKDLRLTSNDIPRYEPLFQEIVNKHITNPIQSIDIIIYHDIYEESTHSHDHNHDHNHVCPFNDPNRPQSVIHSTVDNDSVHELSLDTEFDFMHRSSGTTTLSLSIK